eukprot:PITA_34804
MGSFGELQYSNLHVLIVSFPLQGHINPLLQFAKKLVASENLRVTFVTTEENRHRMLRAQDAAALPESNSSLKVQFETILDGFPVDFHRSKQDLQLALDMLCKIGGLSLTNLIERLNAQGSNICCVVYDSLLYWVPEVAKKFNIPAAFFWTQSCAAYSIYYHFNRGLAISCDETGKATDKIQIPGLPLLNVSDIPSFLQPSNPNGPLLRLVMDQFKTLSEATWILGNSFDVLESKEVNSMKSIAPIRTVGPLIPSAFLDGQDPEDTDFGAHMWKTVNCVDWLNTKEPASVVYVSFGSLSVLSKEQTEEIALGLKATGYSFIWVIRPSSSEGEINTEETLPEGFLAEISGQGLVVPWCPQVQVLSHASVGAFMTHCGWNSTLESLSLGVPLLAVPQWSDQTTNSLYIAEIWKTGLRLNKRPADGLVGKEAVEKCIKVVMESEVGVELRENASRWKKLSREAMGESGSSNKNIQEFVDDIARRASSLPLSG